MSYKLIWENRGVVKYFFDQVSAQDLVNSVIETESDARFDDYRYVINDFLDIAGCSATAAEVEDISVMDKGAAATNPNIRVAIVATHPEILALAKHYANSEINAYPTRIFSNRDDARAWVGANLR
jgi:hypothetical protein